MTHPSGITLFDDRVLVLIKAAEEITAGGIIIPESTRDKEDVQKTLATVEQLGFLAFEDLKEIAPTPNVGDTVLIAKFSGLLIKGPKDGKQYRVISSGDVIARIEE